VALNLPPRLCPCGCNRTFKPVRRNQRFFNEDCRRKFHKEEMVTVRRGDLALVYHIAALYCPEGLLLDFEIEQMNRLKAALEEK
jgi:hypothetical protein